MRRYLEDRLHLLAKWRTLRRRLRNSNSTKETTYQKLLRGIRRRMETFNYELLRREIAKAKGDRALEIEGQEPNPFLNHPVTKAARAMEDSNYQQVIVLQGEEIAKYRTMIRRMYGKAYRKFTRVHERSCCCEDCVFLDQLELVVGEIPKRISTGKVISFTREK